MSGTDESPVLAAFVRGLAPLAPRPTRERLETVRLAGTADPAADMLRALMLADAAVREYGALALSADGHHDDAERLHTLAPITSEQTARAAASEAWTGAARIGAEAAAVAAGALAGTRLTAVWAARMIVCTGSLEPGAWIRVPDLLDRLINAREAP